MSARSPAELAGSRAGASTPAATRRPGDAPGPAWRELSPRRARVLLAGILAGGVALRLVRLGATNLWLDEANSWYVATFPLDRMLGDLQTIPGAAFHAPVYFVMLKAWMAVAGDGEAAMRALSVVLGAALIPLTYALGARLISRQAGLLGAVLIAVSPAQLFFAQEVRMYAALAAFTTAAGLAAVVWWEASSRRVQALALAAYVVFAILALYTHYTAGLLLAAFNLHAAWGLLASDGPPIWRRGRTWAWATAQIALVAAFLPYLSSVDREAAAASQGWRVALGWEGAARELLRYPLELVHGIYHQPLELHERSAAFWRERHDGGRAARLRESVVVFPLLVLTLVCVLARLPRARSGMPGARAFLYLAAAVPLAVGTWVSVGQGLQFTRYFLFVAPYVALLVAGGVLRLSVAARSLALAVLLLAAGFGLARYWAVDGRDSDYRPVARYLAEHARPGDAVLALPADNHVSLLYYLRDSGLDSRAVSSPPALDRSAADPGEGTRTWLVVDYRSPLHALSPRALRDELGAEVEVERRFGSSGSWGVLLVGVRERSAAPDR